MSEIGRYIGIAIVVAYSLGTVLAVAWIAVLLHQIWRESGSKNYRHF